MRRRERLRQILDEHKVTFQRTKTWKESNDPLKEAKLDRIEEVLTKFPDRVFAFDEFGPLAIHPIGSDADRRGWSMTRTSANTIRTGTTALNTAVGRMRKRPAPTTAPSRDATDRRAVAGHCPLISLRYPTAPNTAPGVTPRLFDALATTGG